MNSYSIVSIYAETGKRLHEFLKTPGVKVNYPTIVSFADSAINELLDRLEAANKPVAEVIPPSPLPTPPVLEEATDPVDAPEAGVWYKTPPRGDFV